MRKLFRSSFTRTLLASLTLSSAAIAGETAAGCGTSCGETPFDNGCGAEYESCGESLFGCIDPLTSSPQLTGDWFGNRTALLDSGVKFDANVTNFYSGVVKGGVEQTGRYAGHGDYLMNIDADKLMGMKGMFIKLRAEHRFGESIGEPAGALLPPNIAADLPDPLTEEVILTDVLFTQMFSETFGVFFGKLETFDGDQNAFASGRGVTQFSNSAFVCTPIGFRTIPYSTLGAGFVILQDLQPIFTFSVLNAKNTIREVGISELFNDGAVIAPELRIPTDFFDLPGHQLFGGTWSSRNYVTLDQDPRIILPSVPIGRASDSWSLYYNFDQHLVVYNDDPTKGWGLFGRAGIADEQTNPIGWFLSAGVGGNSPIPGRSQDTFGAGYYFASTSDKVGPILAKALGGIGDSYGTELFYNYEVTRWFHLTADAQFITPAREVVDDAVILGLRGVVTF